MEGKQLLVALFFTIGLVNSDERIYGGYKVDITEAPYMASIIIVIEKLANGTTMVHECSGSILRRNLILTAAHCNVDEADRHQYEAERFFVNVGTNRNDATGGILHSVKTVFTHPKFKNGDANYVFHDVGLLELNDEITLNDKAQLVQLARRDDKPKTGTDCTITGYGKNPDVPSNKLLYQVHMNVITSEQCVKELATGTVKEVEKHEICVKAPGKNQCQGDSGGPLHDVSTKRQVGIVSHGARDCASDSPSILTRVTDNLDYIEKIIRKTTRPNINPPATPSTYRPNNHQPVNPPPNSPNINPPATPPTNPTSSPSSSFSLFYMFKPPFWQTT